MNKSYPKPGAPVNPATQPETAAPGTYTSLPVRVDMTPAVEAIGRLHFEGNLIPHSWYQHPSLRFDDGKANLVAITILADICYWYRPTVLHDEMTGAVRSITKKFAADKLQWDHAQRAERFGLTKRQVQDAFALLKSRGIIEVEIRERWQLPSGATLYNVVFVEPVPDAIAALCSLSEFPEVVPSSPLSPSSLSLSEDEEASQVGRVSRLNGIPPTLQRDTPHAETGYPSRLNGTPPPVKRDPSTKTSTKTSPRTLNVDNVSGEDRAGIPKSPEEPSPSPTLNAEESGVFKKRVLDAVVQVEEITGDTKSRRRYVQLWEICLANNQVGAWDAARVSTEHAVHRKKAAKPGAYFDRACVAELEKRGVIVPPAGSAEERADVRGAIGASLGLGLMV